MPRLFIALVASVAAMGMSASNPREAKLLVGIVVDGLESEYLDLLREHFGNDGFRKLEDEGAIILADYGTPMDATAATATLMTGASPSLNGIAADTRYDRDAMRPVEIYADSEVLGNFSSAGYSPKALRVTTIADEARISSGGTNQVYAIAATPGQAIGLAGHTANIALWLDKKSGNWASSTFYGDIPVAIATRNRTMPLATRLDTMSWTPTLAAGQYPALPDHLQRYPFRYVFPRANTHRLEMFASSPMFNRELSKLAGELITTQKLGQHEGVTDVLNIAYTLQPYNYGKNTDTRPELMDAYIKLDRNLAQLFASIEKGPGLANTVVMLAATPPRGQRRRDDERWSVPYGEFSTRKAISLLNMYLMAVYGNGEYVSAYHNGHLFLNHRLLKERSLNAKDVRAEAASFLAKMTGVDRVHTYDNIIDGRAGENAEALRRSTVATTSGDLLVQVAPGFEIIDDYNNITSNEGPSLVRACATSTAPVFIMGPGVTPRKTGIPVDVRAIAPTVTRILRIRSPNGASVAPLSL